MAKISSGNSLLPSPFFIIPKSFYLIATNIRIPCPSTSGRAKQKRQKTFVQNNCRAKSFCSKLLNYAWLNKDFSLLPKKKLGLAMPGRIFSCCISKYAKLLSKKCLYLLGNCCWLCISKGTLRRELWTTCLTSGFIL